MLKAIAKAYSEHDKKQKENRFSITKRDFDFFKT